MGTTITPLLYSAVLQCCTVHAAAGAGCQRAQKRQGGKQLWVYVGRGGVCKPMIMP